MSVTATYENASVLRVLLSVPFFAHCWPDAVIWLKTVSLTSLRIGILCVCSSHMMGQKQCTRTIMYQFELFTVKSYHRVLHKQWENPCSKRNVCDLLLKCEKYNSKHSYEVCLNCISDPDLIWYTKHVNLKCYAVENCCQSSVPCAVQMNNKECTSALINHVVKWHINSLVDVLKEVLFFFLAVLWSPALAAVL